jgi:hypothetical protein
MSVSGRMFVGDFRQTAMPNVLRVLLLTSDRPQAAAEATVITNDRKERRWTITSYYLKRSVRRFISGSVDVICNTRNNTHEEDLFSTRTTLGASDWLVQVRHMREV